MSTITTYTGIHIDPADPGPDQLDIRDAAHALSLTCRGNGHVKQFYSVGQHCINCCREAAARGYSNRVILACLIHDASEAYMSDVPRPFKQMLGEYLKAEDHLLHMIYEKFLGSDLTEEEAAQVKAIDDDMLWFDLTLLLGEDLPSEKPEIHVELDYTVVPFEQVEEEYLELYTRYAQKI